MLTGPAEKAKSLQSRIISGSVVLLSGSTLVAGINLSYNIAVAHFLGPKGYGHATVVYTLLTLISAITLSFQIISAKLVAQQESLEAKGAAYRAMHRAAWGCGAVISFLLLLFQHNVASYLYLPTPTLIALLAVGAAFYIPLGSRRGYIQGAYGFRRLATNLVLESAVRLGGSVLMVLLGFGVTGVIAANAAAMAVAWVAIAPDIAAPGPNPLRFRYAVREIVQALVFFSGQVLINNCDIVLVKHYFPATEAGLYAAVAMVGRVIFSFSSAVVNSMFPVVAGTRSEERRSLSLIATSLLMVLGIGATIALALHIIPASAWTIFFGAGFKFPGRYGFPYLLTLYAVSTIVYTLSVVIIAYEMSYKIANTSWVQLAFSGLLIFGIMHFHSSLREVILVQLVLMSTLLVVVGVPFLVAALRSARSLEAANARAVRRIRRISEDEVIAEFLKSDFSSDTYRDYRGTLQSIVFAPNHENPQERQKRRALLDLRHRALWNEIPRQTEWYEIEISEANLGQVRVFPRAHWLRIARGCFAIPNVIHRIVNKVRFSDSEFQRKISELRDLLCREESNLGCVILIGQSEKSPLTVIDGNHRLVAAALEGKVHRLRFLCGLSPEMTKCCWYKTNLLTLARYSGNLLRHAVRNPAMDLARLCEAQEALSAEVLFSPRSQ